MTLDSYLAPTALSPRDSYAAQPMRSDQILDDLIHGKSKILGQKLDILAAEMRWRLHMATANLKRIDQDQEQLTATMQRLERQALYGLRDDDEKGWLYRKLLDLETEKRLQHTSCWQDTSKVMRDFLEVWEAHEQSRNRAQFLENVGPRTEGYL